MLDYSGVTVGTEMYSLQGHTLYILEQVRLQATRQLPINIISKKNKTNLKRAQDAAHNQNVGIA